ncbi:MAG: ribosomal L7Ae/L30e/S12e/Gadd45 family protein [Eubacteriales bacterium]|nr:ribosomal L7Ae/L30e/S12e/Gadd45 family protein [Eubacteriales bacterium]MDY3332259.1 ribosomal L7Ae/L30e/S12e/Gadd45 family protein [Gallibacter sp.]
MFRKNNKIDSYIGFARKSNKLALGTEACISKMKAGKIRILVVSEDVSADTKNKLESVAKTTKTKIVFYGDSIETGKIAGNQGSVAYGVMDDNLSEAIYNEVCNMK